MRLLAVCVLAALLAPALANADTFNNDRQIALTAYGQVCEGTLTVPITVAPLPPPTVALATWIGAAPPFTDCAITVDPSLQPGEYRCRVIAGHEFGHLAGLPHSPDPASIMWPELLRFWGPCAQNPIQVAASRGNHYPVGCLRQADVNVGYYPYRVTHATVIRVAPSELAPARQTLAPRGRFAVQSRPNPEHLSDPGQGEPVNGYAWGYAKKGGRSGWVPVAALKPDDPPEGEPWAEGPAGIDFQAPDGFPDDDNPARFTVGKRAVGTGRVTVRTVYLRWAPNSSPMAILLRDEQVTLVWRSGGSYCVTAPDGRRGWMPARTLTRVS